MRVLLFTGKGGVGKTTVAAATAVRAARSGLRTVVCSTDPAHSLADVLTVPLGDTPATIEPNLVGVQLDARRRLEESWGSVREYLVALLDWAGAGTVEAEELAVIPGLDEVFALADIKAFADSGEYDLVVVDCAPTAETLRLLSLPDVLGWYMQRVFPAQRSVTKAVRPLLARMVSMPLAGEKVFDSVRDFYARLDGVRDVLTDGEVTSARLVVNPERVVVAEARRTYTYLALFGYHVDAVVANRLLPDAISDPWFESWKQVQKEQLVEVETAFAPVPVLMGELAADELLGCDRLDEFGARVYGEQPPASRLTDIEPFRIEPAADALVLSMHLPFTEKHEVELGRRNGELLVAVGPHRRAVVLPDSLRRRRVGAARLEGDRLEVEFVEVGD